MKLRIWILLFLFPPVVGLVEVVWAMLTKEMENHHGSRAY